MTHQLFVGGHWHGRWIDIARDDRLCVPVPPTFDYSFTEAPMVAKPVYDTHAYTRRTLVVSVPRGCEGPYYPVRLMVWEPVTDVDLANEALLFNHNHRAELIKRETERRYP